MKISIKKLNLILIFVLAIIVCAILFCSEKIVKITGSEIKTTNAKSEQVIQHTSISGKILLGENKQAIVKLYDENDNLINSKTTDLNGKFEFVLETEGSYYLIIIQDGYLNYRTNTIEILYGYNIIFKDIKMIFGDFNKDDNIEIMDLVMLNDNYKILENLENSMFDDNNDKKINELDREVLKQNYGIINFIEDCEYSVDYTIDYDANGGINAPDYQIKTNGENIKLSEQIPTYEKHTFLGWSISADSSTVDYMPGDNYQLNEKIRLYAIWEDTKYDITYTMNEGISNNPSTYTTLDDDIILEEPTRDGYVFAGWIGSNGEIAQKQVVIATGSVGNKHFEAIWNAKAGVPYRLECYTENLDGLDYTMSEVFDLEGNTDENITAPTKEIEGFTFDSTNANNVLTGTINFEGSLVLKKYYTRNSYRLNTIAGNNILSTSGTGTYKYGEEITINAVLNNITGYTYEFEKWESSNTEKLENSLEQNYTFLMPAENIDITASGITIPNSNIEYNVEYYFETLNDDEYILKESEIKYGKTDEFVSATIDEYEGFTYDADDEKNVASGNILGDGSLILKIYYKRNLYQLTTSSGTFVDSVTGGGTYKYEQSVNIAAEISAGDGYEYTFDKWVSSNSELISDINKNNTSLIIPAGDITLTANAKRKIIQYTIVYQLNSGTVAGLNPSIYNVESENIQLINPTRPGYNFLGWIGSNGNVPQLEVIIAKGTTGAKQYEAVWEAKSGIPYKLNYYLESIDEQNYDLIKIEELTGVTDEIVSITPEELQGCTFNADDERNVLSGKVDIDGSLILKIYYKRNSYTVTTSAGENITSTSGDGVYKFGQMVTVNAVLDEQQGYETQFEQWLSSEEQLYKTDSTAQVFKFSMVGCDVNLTASAKMISSSKVKYTVEHYQESLVSNQYELTETEKFYGLTDLNVSLLTKEFAGFTFDGNNENNVLDGQVRADGTLVLKAYYARNNYNLNVVAGKYISSVSAGGTFKYGQIVSLSAVLENQDGYTYSFLNWISSDESKVSNSNMQNIGITIPAGDITMTASGTRIATKYNITYDYNGGPEITSNPTTYTILSDDIVLVSDIYLGYDFVGWTGSNGDVPQNYVTISKGSTGDRHYKANWKPLQNNPYTTEYYTQNLNDEEYSLFFSIYGEGATDETVVAPENPINGFTFDELNENNVLQGVIGPGEDLVLKRYYKRNSYTLTATAGTNITSTTGSGTYKFEQPVTVNAVVKQSTGYTSSFNSWTSSDTSKVANSTQQQYSFYMPDDNINLVAKGNFNANTNTVYKVQHYTETLTTGTFELKETQTLYGTTDATITATGKTYTGFTLDSTNTNSVPSGKIAGNGSLILKLYYKRNSYKITTAIASTSTDYISSVTATTTYKYGQSVTITATLKSLSGYTYTFSKWTSSDTASLASSTSKSYTFTMPAKSLTMTASATRTVIKYTITLNLNGGTATGSNPTTYTKESSSITLSNPTKTGWKFKGWTGTNGTTPATTLTIPTGSTGNRTYTANWVDTIAPSSPTLVITSGTAGTSPWYKSNVAVKVTQGTDSGVGVLKTTYTVSGATTVAETAITSGNSLTISKDGTSTIKAYTYDKNGNVSAAKTLVIQKDTEVPTIKTGVSSFSNVILNSGTASIKVNASATDGVSGISSYSYYNGSAFQTSSTITYSIANPSFKIRAYDKAGNYKDSTVYSNFYRFIFIAQVYEKMLGRAPKFDEVYYWAVTRYNELVSQGYSSKALQLAAIEVGTSSEASGLSNSTFIDRLFPAYLGRDYENSTVRNNKLALLNTISRRELISSVLESAEFKSTCTKFGLTYSSDI